MTSPLNRSVIACVACGIVLSVSGGRCPSCGALQPDAGAGPSVEPTIQAAPRGEAARTSSHKTALVLLAGAAVAAAGLAAVLLVLGQVDRTQASAAPPVSAPEVPPSEERAKASSEYTRAEPGAFVSRARARARSWQAEAELVSIEASPVMSGTVDVTGGGKLAFGFGKRSGLRMGAGAPVGSGRLVLSVEPGGLAASEEPAAGAARAVPDPDCPLDEAWQKVIASGVPSSQKLSMRYAMSDKHERAVWTAATLGEPRLTRTLDGASCVILVR
jgi:hypothetical protein